jgi:hypothetical protein
MRAIAHRDLCADRPRCDRAAAGLERGASACYGAHSTARESPGADRVSISPM